MQIIKHYSCRKDTQINRWGVTPTFSKKVKSYLHYYQVLLNIEEHSEEGEEVLEREESSKWAGLGQKPHRSIFEEFDNAHHTRQSRDTGGEIEEVCLPAVIKQGVLCSLVALQIILDKKGPDSNLDNKLCEALHERLDGGDVGDVGVEVGPPGPPLRALGQHVDDQGQGEVLRPHLASRIKPQGLCHRVTQHDEVEFNCYELRHL